MQGVVQMAEMNSLRKRLIFALDVPEPTQAEAFVRQLNEHVGLFKVGLELFMAAGPGIVSDIQDLGGEVFLDLKLHDIPATVGRAAQVAAGLGVKMLTVHASSGPQAVGAAVEAAREGSSMDILAVTVLTSLNGQNLKQLGLGSDLSTVVKTWARLAREGGASGLVASPHEVAMLRDLWGDHGSLVIPGVRPAWYQTGDHPEDQQRIATPRQAVADGADYLVVGRPIRDAPDPVSAAQRIVEEIGHGLDDRKGPRT